ncbi:Fungalysin metallopeptidase-domain-containing protein [Crassisporium funariophilum]|nr:Fungalysin metallopeptidase-domain-containing protein [Crassisporium funariophilum]
MGFLRSLWSPVLVAVASLYLTDASSPPSTRSHAHPRPLLIDTGLDVDVYHPTSSFETFGEGIDHPLSKRLDVSLSDAAISFLGSRLAMDTTKIAFRNGYAGDVSHNTFLTQTHNGIPIANAVANVVFNKQNKVVAFGSSFISPRQSIFQIAIASPVSLITLATAISLAERVLNGKFTGHRPTLEFFAKRDHTLVLTHVIQIKNDTIPTSYEAFVDVQTGELVSVIDYVLSASYLVLPIQKQTLLEGFQSLTDPQDVVSSPLGWHSNGTVNSTGNNIISFKASINATTSQSSAGLNFVFVQDAASSPTIPANVDAARVNAFYVANTVHDTLYRYGFTESAFNFQSNNFGKGGTGNDPIQVFVQDTLAVNNALFITSADGQPAQLRLFLWNLTTPGRDGAIENDIVTHEMTHGLTTRMTGGGTGRCLLTTESGGMGEGWSDTMADWNEKSSSSVPDFVIAPYVSNNPAGIRNFPYSTNATTNPLRYSALQTLTEVHDIGEVWANMLHNVYANLVEALGWSATARTDPNGSQGNIVFLHLFVDALPIQPCNPTFVNARDAWIQADANRYNSAHTCILWKAFASRGLGMSAAGHADDFTVPASCI